MYFFEVTALATWNESKQRWSWADKKPIKYCFVDKKPGESHPNRNWTDEEKKAARHAIEEWNKALKDYAKKNKLHDIERIKEAASGEKCNVTLRWEDSSFFKNYEVKKDGKVTHGVDISGTTAWADRVGVGSLKKIKGKSGTPFTPGRDTTKFPTGEIYFNVKPTAASILDFKGWFVDPTPENDDEFEAVLSDEGLYEKLQAKKDGNAYKKVDFYTVAKHEFGHMLGLDHKGKAGDSSDKGEVMRGGAGGQERRHNLPIMDWALEQRRHLIQGDIDYLEEYYRDEFQPSHKYRKIIGGIVGLAILIIAIIFGS